ncbi:Multiple sugar-binding protein precursor [Paenibacillus sp. P1XP2]|nr:Multiple sugar-binding protein precursor [Paenibacillus sp. P1XP2]
MKLHKKISFGVMAAVLAISLSACGGSNGGSASNSKSDKTGSGNSGQKQVTIEYWHTYGEQEEKVLMEEVVPKFEEEHPEIKVNLTRMPYEGLKEQVIAGVAGDAAPDLMRMDIIWVPEFAKMGALQDVSKMEGFEEVKSSVFDAPMETNHFDSGYYGVPLNTNTKIAIYNKTLLEKIGLTEAPKTMDEFVAASKKAMEKGAKGAIGISGAHVWGVSPYFWSLGGVLTNEDYTKVEAI